MKKVFNIGYGLLSVVALSITSHAMAKPPLQNIQVAQQRIVAAKVHLDRVIAGGGAGGGGINQCQGIRSPRQCIANGCNWDGNLEIGRCVPRGHLQPREYYPENDVAAQLASTGISIGMQRLADDMFQMTAHYWDPNFDFFWNKACKQSGKLLVANQGAKVAAALPQIGNFRPEFFEMYDQELIATRQLIWCN